MWFYGWYCVHCITNNLLQFVVERFLTKFEMTRHEKPRSKAPRSHTDENYYPLFTHTRITVDVCFIYIFSLADSILTNLLSSLLLQMHLCKQRM